MAFGSNDFPLGPNGKFPKQRISSAGNEIADPHEMEEMYSMTGLAKLPAVEKDYHSSVGKVKDRMKTGKPHKSAEAYDDVDKYRPKYAPKSSLRKYDAERAIEERQQRGNDEWLLRRRQRFPYGLQNEKRTKFDIVRPATGMSGVGFFGKHGELGDVEQKFQEDMDSMRRRHRTKF